MSSKHKVSVIMLVYNRENYLKQAIESILNQTYTNLELIIIDDGSSDNSMQIAESFADPRIILIKNEYNKGIPTSRNIGIIESKGEYIFNLDSDDECSIKTIEKEVDFLDKNLDYGVCSCFYKINNSKKIIYPSSNEEIKAAMLFNNYISNPASMIRKKLLDDYNLKYNIAYKASEDYELFSRLMDVTKFYNIPDFLLNYRQHPNQCTNILNLEMKNFANEVRKNLLKKISLEFLEKDFKLFQDFSEKTLLLNNLQKEKSIFRLITTIIEKNRETNYFAEEDLHKIIACHLFIIYGKNYGLLQGSLNFLRAPIYLNKKLTTFSTMLNRL